MRSVIIGLLGFSLAVAQGFAADNSTEPTLSRSFTVEPGGDLSVDAEQGDIHITSGNQDKVDIIVEREVPGESEGNTKSALKNQRVKISQQGNSVHVEIGAAKSRGFSFHKPAEVTSHIRITVPKRFNVSLTTAGTIEVTGLHGSVDARSSGGNLSFANIEGALDAHTGGGNIRAENCSDQMTVQTSGGTILVTNFSGSNVTADSLGGDIEANNCEGKLQAKTSGGDIIIRNFTGDGVYGDTSGGRILFDLAKSPILPCSLRTGGGNITARLANDVAMNVSATSDGGNVNSAIPIDATVKGRTKEGQIEGKINGGGPMLTLKTVGGDIEILRR